MSYFNIPERGKYLSEFLGEFLEEVFFVLGNQCLQILYLVV